MALRVSAYLTFLGFIRPVVSGGVKGVYTQDKEVSVPEAVCLPLQGFDLVVGAFQGAGGNPVVVVCEDSSARVRRVLQRP